MEIRDRSAAAFADHPSFERVASDEYRATSTPFEAVVRVSTAEDGEVGVYTIEVRLPTLDAVVEGETVADVVAEGWFETLERRLADARGVTRADATPPEATLAGESVVVETTVRTGDPTTAPEEALALVEYVEGTWVQGVIPGYEYGEPASELIERANQEYD